jgi:deoxyribodipyrimidine photolyase
VDPAQFMQPPSDRLAKNYPLPIVDHAQERLVALERLNLARRGN